MPEVELLNPSFVEEPNFVELTQPAVWVTPGMYLAQRIFDFPQVRFVGERYESDYLQTVVVLENDPEDVLNAIFTTEQEMFRKFGRLRFDVRVRVIPLSANFDLIKTKIELASFVNLNVWCELIKLS